MLQWFNASLNRKIGSLFVLLLSFLFVVIIFSIYKLRLIDFEMKQVSEVDIPLNEVIGHAEMLQLKQHIFMEQFRRLGGSNESFSSPETQFDQRRDALSTLLNRAVNIINKNVERHKIRFELLEHEALLSEIEAFHQHSDDFERQLGHILSVQNISESDWRDLENVAFLLDRSMGNILTQIESLSLEAAKYTEKHEREFMFINGMLGAGALVIGLLLTVYIIQVIRIRILRIHHQVDNIHESIETGTPIKVSSVDESESNPQDELGELEQDLQKVVRRLSDEMVSRMEAERQLMVLVTKDKLTGAYNRHKWDEQIKVSLDLAQRGTVFSLIMLDIDCFKKINDQFGHQVGDAVLQFFASSLLQCLRKSDLLFRMGGEEFAVLLPQQPLEKATQVAERILESIEMTDDDRIPPFTVSAGVSTYRSGDDDNSILTRADKALYQSKLNGRNRVTSEGA
ncbi:sensor domain-containing diguanylate cyclase [Marinomonas mediterranea]|uniref:GGDEF domain-containing protein n=1 Tax=Marinomonas mediterranea TaxID=119864 RepID=UPI00234B6B98|nr:GGDEF domain-containing protein [Marinomonas mediterranea]WCN08570.1 diguanylate cyclase [Marinomonas mediterranea]